MRISSLLAVAAAALAAAACTPRSDDRHAERQVPPTTASRPVETSGRAARELLAARGFEWRVLETPHARVHVPAGAAVAARAAELGDSVEAARGVALRLLGEPDLADEPKLELFFVDRRDDMRRLMGRPIGGFAQPGELTAAFVAGPGYKPFLRHELTHAYAFVRWGELRAGAWLTEGLAALAQGACQGHSVDELAAGFVRRGAVPPLRQLAADFRAVPELPGYLTAASAADFLRHRVGVAGLRALWRGEDAGATGHPLGAAGAATEAAWRRQLADVTPAELDTLRLRREGC